MSYLINFIGKRKQATGTVLFTQTSTVTVANTVTETAITDGGVGSLTLPANYLVAGRSFRLFGSGFHSNANNNTLRIRVKLGSVTVLDTGAQGSNASTNDGFIISANITCRTTGASGTVMAQGEYKEFTGTPSAHDTYQLVNTATTTIDTTASNAISITVEWGTASASNTISLTNFTVEGLN